MSKTRAKAEDVTDVTLPCLQAAADDGQLASQSLGMRVSEVWVFRGWGF